MTSRILIKKAEKVQLPMGERSLIASEMLERPVFSIL